ncbi:hypothetical protein ACHAXM_004634 [Skeletonema potamos]
MNMSSLYNSSSPSRSENNIVTIDLTHHPPNAKLGMLLAPGALPTPMNNSDINSNNHNSTHTASSSSLPSSSNVTLVAGWEHGTNQQLGPIQRSGMVRLGDRLVRINGRDVTDWTFREVMDALKEMITTSPSLEMKRKRRLKNLGFAPSGTEEWSQGVIIGGEEFNSTSMLFGLFQSQESKVSPHVISKILYSFVSFVGRWRVVIDEPTTAAAVASASSTTTSLQTATIKADITEEKENKEQLQQDPQRQISENSTDLLEEQLNKEPSMKFDGVGPIDKQDDDNDEIINQIEEQSPNQDAATPTETATPSIFSPEAEAEWHKEITEFQEKNRPQKKIVQYEIQCHLLLRDPNSFKSNKSTGNRNNNIHHSWSVWKRYSEFQSLDTELRKTFGWQMDATDDGKGIIFPGAHGLESWWYGLRNGGGYLTSLMGGSYGVDVDAEARVDDEADKKKANKTDKGGGGEVSSGVFGFFSRSATTESAATGTAANGNNNNDDSNNNASISSTTCPYPKPFIERRQKELGSYWINLSRVEDIFEFRDINSHRFGTLMASFLEVDQVLLTKRNSRAAPVAAASSPQQRNYQPISPSRSKVPVIHENETELFSFGARKSEQWQSPLTPSREFSDEVSILSDGTGANAYLTRLKNNHSPVHARRLLVDNVPAHFTSNNPLPLTAENRSVSSKSTKRVGGRGASRRTKPAFQRQFMD